jgi:Cys-tRNA(Pro)/Cys-tRNA(Cys) deacylase
MKKPFPTFIEESATLFDTICCSAGKVGAQVQLSATDLATLVGAQFVDLV